MLRKFTLTVLLALLAMPLAIGHVNAAGSWSSTTSYPTGIMQPSCVADLGSVYCIGGWSTSTGYTNASYFAPVSATGVGSWSLTTAYPGALGGMSCVVNSGYVYCIGGYSSGVSTNAVNFAPLSSAGVGSWSPTTAYPMNIYIESCVVDSGYVYCVGGYTDSGFGYVNAVYSAPLSSSGVGSWSPTTFYPTGVEFLSCVVDSGQVACIGGYNNAGYTSAVYSAPLSAGVVGSWSSNASYPTPIGGQSCVMDSGYVDCIGGHNGVGYTDAVYLAPWSAGISAWASTTPYPTSILGQSCAVDSGYVYCAGGYTGSLYTNAVDFVLLSSLAVGGNVLPLDKFALLSPYLGAVFAVICSIALVYLARILRTYKMPLMSRVER